MLSDKDIRDAYILYISGAAKIKVDGESKNEVVLRMDDYNNETTIEFVGGVKKVIERQYCDNGVLGIRAVYKNDKREGKVCFYYSSGSLHAIEHYKAGVIIGLSHGWYESGEKEWVTHYKDDKHNGKNIEFWSNGKKREEGYYVDGKYRGLVKKYNNEGKLLAVFDYQEDGSVRRI